MKLYEITHKIDEAVDKAIDPKTGEVIDEKLMDEVDKLEDALEDKAQRIALFTKELDAEIEVLKKEEARLAARRRSLASKIDGLKTYLEAHIEQGRSIKGTLATIFWGTTESIVVDVKLEKLAPEYVKRNVSTAPDKEKLAAHIKLGKEVEGARLVRRRYIVIR